MIRILLCLLILTGCAEKEVKSSKRIPIEPQQRDCFNKQELSDRIYLDRFQRPEYKVIAYSKSAYVEKGDRIVIQSISELTNDLGHIVMVVYYVQRTLNGKTEILGRKVGGNITPGMHHWPYDLVRFDTVFESGIATYELVFYAAANIEKQGDFLIIEQCYGSFNVFKL